MKRLLSLCIIVFMACQAPSNPNPPSEVLNALDEASLKEHLTYISSDEMKGRETGSPELKKVAEFLSNKLKSYGYKGLGENGSFLQPFTLVENTYDFSSLTMGYKNALKVRLNENTLIYNRNKTSLSYSNDVVFVGEGLYTSDRQDYSKDDINGNIVFRYSLSEETKNAFPNEGDRKIFRYLTDSLGAVAVITVLSDSEADTKAFNQYKHFSGGKSMMFGNAAPKPTAILIKESVAKQFYKADRKKTFKGLKSFKLKYKFQLTLNATSTNIHTQNVVAHLKGSDANRAHEYVAYGSHYDHVGVKDGEIYNGADDDGSGTVAVLEMAKAISKNPPKRSTMIIFHTGEEKGLLGSKYYSENQLVKMENIVAMFNMDMIGRSADKIKENDNTRLTLGNEIYVIGADKISHELHTISEKMNDEFVKMDLNYALNEESHPARIYYRSDHWNYAKHGVPVIFYFDGIHEDYHKPTDTVEKIDFNKIKNVSKLALATGYYVSNKDARIVIGTK